jgi:Terminase large subunit gpA, endonuclease domain
VARLKLPYRSRDIPAGVLFLTAGIDVQKNRLVYVIKKSARLENADQSALALPATARLDQGPLTIIFNG